MVTELNFLDGMDSGKQKAWEAELMLGAHPNTLIGSGARLKLKTCHDFFWNPA